MDRPQVKAYNIGLCGERLAAAAVAAAGHAILARRFRCIGGEIDIITEYRETVYFWEIKTYLHLNSLNLTNLKLKALRSKKCIRSFLNLNPHLFDMKITLGFYLLYQKSGRLLSKIRTIRLS